MITVGLVAVASVKASPGVTTTALALAAAWPARRRLLIEADPSGGDLGPWLGLPAAPGLASLAAAARHDHRQALIWHHAQELAAGLHVIVAPAGAGQAGACLSTLAATSVLAPVTSGPAVVVADCGRLDPGSPAMAVAAQASLTLLVTRPYVSDLSHLAPRLAVLSSAGIRAGLLLAPADRPPQPAYGTQEIASTLGIPVQAVIPQDPRAAAQLIEGRGVLAAGRSPLVQAIADLAAALDTDSSWPPAPGPQDQYPGEVTAGERTA